MPDDTLLKSVLRQIHLNDSPPSSMADIANARAIDAAAMAMMLQLVIEPIVMKYLSSGPRDEIGVGNAWMALKNLIDDHVKESDRIAAEMRHE